MFDRDNPPDDMPVEWIDATNQGIKLLRSRKLTRIDTKAAKEHPNVRAVYDELSEVGHPTRSARAWHLT
jgi:hypothetical protein